MKRGQTKDSLLKRKERDLAIEVMGRRIAEARQRSGMTQYKLAQLAECRPETIHRLERGRNMPDAMLLDKIAQSLDTTSAWLLRGDPS